MKPIKLIYGGSVWAAFNKRKGTATLDLEDNLSVYNGARVELTATEVEALILDLQELRYKLVDHAIGVLSEDTNRDQ